MLIFLVTIKTANHCNVKEECAYNLALFFMCGYKIRFSWGSGTRSVVVGMHSMSGEATSKRTIAVEEIIDHEDYDNHAYDQDIMLLKLAESIDFSDQVSPVCLPAQDEVFDAGTKCYTTGWGNLEGKTTWLI